MPDAKTIRPLAAMWHFIRAAILLVVAFYAFKYAYFLVSEHPRDLGLEAGAEKAKAAASRLEAARDRK